MSFTNSSDISLKSQLSNIYISRRDTISHDKSDVKGDRTLEQICISAFQNVNIVKNAFQNTCRRYNDIH